MIFHILATFLFVTVVYCAESDSKHRCQTCHAFGKTRRPNSEFIHIDGCRKYVCDCSCDGSYECPAEKIGNVCKPYCTTCLVEGELREGNQPFQMTDECYQYNCFCKCDGSWDCPKDRIIDVCNTNATTGCYFCDVHGEKFQGNSLFKHTDDCIEYSCRCNCDGSWDCPGDKAIDRCNTNPDTGCYYCNVTDKRYEGNSYFKYVNGCVEYRCVCNCDGSWNCPGEDAVDVCRTNSTTGCYYCEADDYLYQGNSRFPLVRECFRYHCTCGCDGGWTCKDSIGKYICDENGDVPQECKTCNIDGNIFRGDSRFFYQRDCIKYMCTCDCQGRHYCSGNDARNTCPGSDPDDLIPTLAGDGSDSSYPYARTRSPRQTSRTCVPCIAGGRSYRNLEEFELVQGCTKFTCTCFCDGHYDCPPYLTKQDEKCKGPSGGGVVSVSTDDDDDYGSTGVSTCRQCQYEGYTYSKGRAQLEKGCWQLNCECFCNGTLECPSDRSEWICGGRPRCTRCQVEVDGQNYGSFEPKADFQITHDDINYNCSCFCDGGWNCKHGEYATEQCSGCTVDGATFRGNASFQLTRGCDLYPSCYCTCGGDWSCSGEGIEDVCGLCRKCKIGDNYFDGDATGFQATIGFTRYSDCDCACDGKWECRGGYYTRDRGDQPIGGGECGDCVIGGRRYRTGQRFNHNTDCTEYKNCECRCGDRFCREVKDTCGNCRSCEVEGNKYGANEKFSLKQECIIYKDCTCTCDGTWRCSGEGAIDTCNACKKCNFENTLYEPYSHFMTERTCWRYKCFCGCDGSISCPSITAVNICNYPDDCGTCEVNGAIQQGNTHFEYDLNGLRMSCKCNCDSSYICIAEWINYISEATAISGSGIGSGAGSCQTCFMNNHYYRGNSNYTIVKSGVELNCECFCNGGYYCYGEKLYEDQRCRRCSIFGTRYKGDTQFPLIYRGLKVSCTCSCDGSYVCYGADESRVISCVRGSGCLPSSCSKCNVDGVTFNGGDTFGTRYKNIELRCECGCDGSYYCEGSGGIILSCFRGQCRELGCSSCSVFDDTYIGGSSFEIIYEGIKVACTCECGGNYQCIGSDSSIVVSCVDERGCLPRRCDDCYVNGRSFAGGRSFLYDYNGIAMNCTCGCDSSYYCSGIQESIEIACVGGRCNRIGCKACNVFGEPYDGDSSFDLVYSGELLRCQCSCDASYRCVGSSGSVTVVCVNGRGRGCLPSTCQSCLVKGREYTGGSKYRSTYKGIDITCTCGCDGTSHCIGDTTSIEVSCIRGVCNRIGCGECNIFGTDFLGNSQFDIVYRGVKVTCSCDCDGSYICRGSTGAAIVTCSGGVGCLPSSCQSCDVDGRPYRGTSNFDYRYNGIEMKCICGCDGSYFCEGVREKIQISCYGGTCNPVGCQSCRVFNQDVTSLSSFNLIYGGLLLDCKCDCKGNYLCVGSSGNVILQCVDGRGCPPEICQSCTLNGRNYVARQRFEYDYNGYAVDCQCGCDGSVYCTGTQITVSCIGGICSPVGCTTCEVFGTEYAGLSQFDIIYNGLKMTCRCDCLGGYICQGRETTTTITCKDARGCLSKECQTCSFNGRSYRGMAVFKYKYKNIDFSCTCGCDSTVYCEGIDVKTILRCINGDCTPMGCENCKIFGKDYAPLTQFNIIYQGVRLGCDCDCLGGYICKGSTGVKVVECLPSGRGCLANTCANCVRRGRSYRAGDTFSDIYQEIDVDCTCSCDGSSFCTGVDEAIEIACIGENCSPINCQNCNIFGNDYAAVSSFNLIYRGVEIDCRCGCDGSYICRGSTGDRVVECLSDGRGCLPDSCKNCFLNGREYRARTMFPSVYKGIDMNCKCGCDGSSFCEGITEVITISCIGDTCSPVGCGSCNIFGQDYAGDSTFEIVYQGTKMQCDCKCDTAYRCIGSTGETTIQCRAGRRCLPKKCRKCRVNGLRHPGNSRFDSEYKGIPMKCVCGCDGSYFCQGSRTDIQISCPRRGACTQIGGCRSCSIFGIEFEGNSRKSFVYQGYNMDCQCSCDSSYRCIGTKGEVTTSCEADRNCLPPPCRSCNVNGKTYRGNARFVNDYQGISMNCICGCDGSYFCRGAKTDIQVSCARQGDCTQIGCRKCNIFGIEFEGNTRKDFVYQGYNMQCECSCDSSYRCIGTKGEVTTSCAAGRNCLPPPCRSCNVDGRTHTGNSRFTHSYKGIQMKCVCGCDGSYLCRGERVDIELSCTARGECTQVGCSQCSIFGIKFEGNSRRDFVYQGYNMQCECSCDSSYRCIGTKGEVTTSCAAGRNCLPPPCRSCNVNGQTHTGNSRFTHSYKGIQMNCVCGCDGSYFCRGDRVDIELSCPARGECTQTGCRKCNIFGIEFEGNSQKEFVYQGYNMNCQCACDSSYRCVGVKGEVTTSCRADGNCLPPPCRSCQVDGKTIRGNTRFQHIYKGIPMECVCGCDSTYFCRGVDTTTEISCLRDSTCQQVGCQYCLSDGREHLVGAEFEKLYDGIRMNCLCNCDGSYRCQGVSITIIISCTGEACRQIGCRSCLHNNREIRHGTDYEKREGNVEYRCQCQCDGSSRCEVVTPACQSCLIDGRSHEGNTRFRIYRDRNPYICSCDCNGRHECEPERPVRPTCRSCDIFGRTYEGNRQYKVDIRNLEYDCTCNCNGTWRCVSDLFGYSCEGSDCAPTTSCTNCVIEGRSFQADTSFTDFVFGERMNCQCNCDGGYRCESDTQVCTSIRGCQSKCRECDIEGRRYPGNNAAFDANVDGRRMTCQCDCSGRYRCEGGGYVCTTSEGCLRQCRDCVIEGTVYRGDTQFQANVEGRSMSCSCDCSGLYTCRGGNFICTSATGCRSSCKRCRIDGVFYDENPAFSAIIQGSPMTCSCDCSGSYSCQSETQICTSRRGCISRCVECEIDGKLYQGDTKFEIDHSMGIRMSCECRCNGGYTCNGTKETTTCIGSGCDDRGCKPCVVDSVEHPGGSTFEIDRSGVRMVCSCDCNGGYKCRGETTVTTCEGPGCPGQCGPCVVDNREIDGNTRFELERDGVKLDCICRCDGGYSCEGTKVCSGSGCRTTGCKRCIINEVPYTGNTRFSIPLRGVSWTCTCYCDGSYSCTSPTGIVQSCIGSSCASDSCRNCLLDGKEYELDSRFRLQKNDLTMNCVCECDGAYRCFSISGTCVGPECDEYGCKSCIIDGNTYKGNTDHTIRRGGRDMVCTCECSGHYTCRHATLQVECVGADCGVGGCRSCRVDREFEEGNTRFQFSKYGLSMQCACNCDSSFTCRGYQIISTGTGYEDTCGTCEINGRTYNGNTRFQAMINGVRSICSCECSGRHTCQGATPTCRSCNIGDDRYQGNSDFVLRRDGHTINCRCECNGDFVCTGRRGESSVIGGCRDCFIFGTRYKADTKFTTDARGIRMLCECHCNGGYSCKGYRTVTSVTLPSERRTNCATCYVDRRNVQADTPFQIQRGCFQINCQCLCDGSWECPFQTPKYTCEGRPGSTSVGTYTQERYSIAGSHVYRTGAVDSDSRTVITGVDTSDVISTGICSSCSILGKDYDGNTAFTLQDGCLRFGCACDCSGQWNCSSVEGSDCTELSNIFDSSDCRQCEAFGRLHSANSKFAGQDECYLYSCYCYCNGSWQCPPELTVKTCADTSAIYDPDAGTCRQCVLGENRYDYKEAFEVTRNCIRYRCVCGCDGTYTCPSRTATRVCRTGSGLPGRIPSFSSSVESSYSSTIDGSSRTIDGSSRTPVRGSGVGGSSVTSDEGSGRTVVNIRPPDRSSLTSTGGSSSTSVSTSSSSSSSSSSRTSSSSRRTGGAGTRSSSYEASRSGSSTSGTGGSIDLGSLLTGGSDRGGSGRGGSGRGGRGGPCKNCIVDDQPLEGGHDFTFRSGCTEYLCECFCNGTYVCPPERSSNFCDDKVELGQRKGCTVGRKTYKTELFSYTEDCKKYICRCYDNGSYRCDPKKTRKIC